MTQPVTEFKCLQVLDPIGLTPAYEEVCGLLTGRLEVAVPCGGTYGLVTENAQEMSVGKVLGDFKTLYHSFLSV